MLKLLSLIKVVYYFINYIYRCVLNLYRILAETNRLASIAGLDGILFLLMIRVNRAGSTVSGVTGHSVKLLRICPQYLPIEQTQLISLFTLLLNYANLLILI